MQAETDVSSVMLWGEGEGGSGTGTWACPGAAHAHLVPASLLPSEFLLSLSVQLCGVVWCDLLGK